MDAGPGLRRLGIGENDAGLMISSMKRRDVMPAIDAVIVAAIVAAFVIFLGVLAWAEREKTLGRSAVSSLSLLIRSQRPVSAHR